MGQNGFVFDNRTGLYYDYSSGFYYDPVSFSGDPLLSNNISLKYNISLYVREDDLIPDDAIDRQKL